MSGALKTTTVSGQPCLSMEDAQDLARMMAEDEAQPFLIASSCSYRTELMVGKMLQAGVPCEAIARVYQAVPGGEDVMMTADKKDSDRGSFQRLLGIAPNTTKGTYEIPNAHGLKVKFTGGNGVFLQSADETKGWNREWGKGFRMNADNAAWAGQNHITGGVYVQDAKTGQARLMVIDPHLDQDNPLMTPAEWKKRVHCDASVVMAGKIGAPAKILSECLTPSQKEKMQAAMPPEGRSGIAGAALLNPRDYNNVVRTMFNLDDAVNVNGFRDLGGINAAKFSAITKADWNHLTADERPVLLQAWIDELKPLRDLQDAWQAKFAPQPRSPQPKPAGTGRHQPT